jgi:hypothetical protein
VKRFLMLTAALVAAVSVLVGFRLPPRRLALPAPTDGSIAGILHIHTIRSDGRGSPEDIAVAAARAGLKFIVFTDHGDATRTPDPPMYRAGVLCLDAVEISTSGGHYVVLDMPAAPYPLGGEPRDVVEDVHRLGGFGIAAHPDSPKTELRWREWTAPFDGMELVNPDTSWRLLALAPDWRPRLKLLDAVFHYPFRPAETIASLLVRSDVNVYRWQTLANRRRFVGIAGIDAHAKLQLYNADSGDNRWSAPLPSYEASFRTMSTHVTPDRPFSGNAAADAATIVRAIRAGHLYTAVDGIATPASLEFTASNLHGVAHEGDELKPGGPVTLHVRSNAPPEFTTIVWQGAAQMVGEGRGPNLDVRAMNPSRDPDESGVFWVEIRRPGAPMSWIISNPIYVRAPADVRPLPPRAPASTSTAIFDGRTGNGWSIEHDPTSLAAFEVSPAVGGSELRVRYGLFNGPRTGQFAALARATPGGVAQNDRVTFTGRAERPMRISVQLRAGDGTGPAWRWQRSIYLDAISRERTVYFDDLTPIGPAPTWKPDAANVHDILFVVDTANTKPGASGRFWITAAALQR